jgi:D-sedoheptulose 7-phosphate isomerase
VFSHEYLDAISRALLYTDPNQIDTLAFALYQVREKGGRLFILGNGGSAANASHAVNDFRKLDNFEAYCPTDNVAELTARINDDGFGKVFFDWLRTSKLNEKDAVIILSVGGGNLEKKVSMNLISAATYTKTIGAKLFSIVGKDGGEVAKLSDMSIIIPTVHEELITPIVESLQSVILHLLVTHHHLKENKTVW